ncbi:hypothetical protein VTN00DRAFT_5898 [Thermoascus crustaceus]|uniref:uncharacterized protein n=1 Tax=Thermoascus crustaceus TaxID=5088 RepID=UPI0037444BDB
MTAPGAPPPPSTLNTPITPPPATLDHFRSHHPWATALLSSPDYFPIQTWSRIRKPDTGEDGYFSTTLATPTTIPHVVTLRRRNIDPVPKQPPSSTSLTSSSSKPTTPDAPSYPPDLLMLLSLSAPGISGHPSTAHGGAVATILDEALSLAVALHVPSYGVTEDEADSRGKIYTLQLDVRYRRPVVVPGLLVVRAWCVARDGRKYWMRGQVVQEEEEEGVKGKRKVVKAEALGFWVETAGKL